MQSPIVVEETMHAVRAATHDWYYSTKKMLERPRLDAYHIDLDTAIKVAENNSPKIPNGLKQ